MLIVYSYISQIFLFVAYKERQFWTIHNVDIHKDIIKEIQRENNYKQEFLKEASNPIKPLQKRQ